MPWSIDGPTGDQLGYARRRARGVDPELTGPRSAWRWVGLVVLAIAVVVLVVGVVLHFTQEPPPITTQALGSWREVGTEERYLLDLDRDDDGACVLTYARAGGTQRPHVKDGRLVIMPTMADPDRAMLALSYDPATDRLTALTDDGTYTLERVQ